MKDRINKRRSATNPFASPAMVITLVAIGIIGLTVGLRLLRQEKTPAAETPSAPAMHLAGRENSPWWPAYDHFMRTTDADYREMWPETMMNEFKDVGQKMSWLGRDGLMTEDEAARATVRMTRLMDERERALHSLSMQLSDIDRFTDTTDAQFMAMDDGTWKVRMHDYRETVAGLIAKGCGTSAERQLAQDRIAKLTADRDRRHASATASAAR